MMTYSLGLDIGSTTAKAILLDSEKNEVYKKYIRHNTEVYVTLMIILAEIKDKFGDIKLKVAITGTAGMGVAEKSNVLFIQEVVACAYVAEVKYRNARTLIDLGGEDAKIIFFNADMKSDIRMNGACAGGTGAFIDQMATLLNIKIEDLNDVAKQSTQTYPIASRCGVFGKTDVQNLISRGIPAADIASSIFRAVAFQTVNALARGFDIKPKIIFSGGPLTFQSELRKSFYDVLNISSDDVIDIENGEALPALGCALYDDSEKTTFYLNDFYEKMALSRDVKIETSIRLEPLFKDEKEFLDWKSEKERLNNVEKVDAEKVPNHEYFLGIDSGSTTTKVVLIDRNGAVAAKNYSTNNGNPIDAVHRSLTALKEELDGKGITNPKILRSATTGYGEDLTHFAFKFDDGLVETLAHFKAASHFNQKVSFILDIGGQDMKAIFIKDGIINNLELNESCSSGSGSFIETFAKNLNIAVPDFAMMACESRNPFDLGTRCTVFMNSKVKQALREGATQGDISAGLAYSVIKNCFNKVLKMTNMDLMGDNIVVQGGTFKNHAVLRALEKITKKNVVRPDISELMGAYGAALTAKDKYTEGETSTFIGFSNLDVAKNNERKALQCKGCENICRITQIGFANEDRKFYTGNKCDKYFTNKLKANEIGFNMHDYKRDLLFNRDKKAKGKEFKGIIGIPRVLNMWEDFPFWNTMFTELGFDVVLSSPSTMPLAEKGYGGVMSENICFPAKIVGGHIVELAEAKVDRIFYPMVSFGRKEFDSALNQYNCPVVTGYPEVIESAINTEEKYKIPLDKPSLAFNNEKLQYNSCKLYFVEKLGLGEKDFKKAFYKAIEMQGSYHLAVQEKAAELIAKAKKNHNLIIMLLGRPYHVDSLVNHKLPEMITSMGIDILTEDSLPLNEKQGLSHVEVLTQWGYPNRIYDATLWAATHHNVEVVQINSFGCGPDAVVVDEVKAILNTYGKNPTLIRVDEITSPGSVKLRVRSMIESMIVRPDNYKIEKTERVNPKIFGLDDKIRTIIGPNFCSFYTEPIIKPFRDAGYNLEILPDSDRASVDLGLAYANNDICYPATIVIGDLLKALQSGKYKLDEVAVVLTQTGGQCRASSYISMLKKALVNAGLEQVPVIAVNTHVDSGSMNSQPGFVYDKQNFMLESLIGILFGDIIAKLYWATAARELNKGEARALADKYIDIAKSEITYKHPNRMIRLAKKMIGEFNLIECYDKELPKVGIVGEIFVKFNEFSNNYTGQWLIKNGIEPEFPPLVNFFLTTLVETRFNKKNHLVSTKKRSVVAIDVASAFIRYYINKVNDVFKLSKIKITPIHDIYHIANHASKVLNLSIQFGESWLLPGDIITFEEEGVHDVVSLQPFGCIANHIISKGLEKKLKEKYPKLNLSFIDMDSGSSEVNIANRLSFLARGAVESMKNK